MKNIETIIYDKADEIIEEILTHSFIGIELGWKHQFKVRNLSLIVLICYIPNITNYLSRNGLMDV